MKSHRGKRELLGNRKAFVTVYMLFASLVMLPMVGLAIDFSVLYSVKGRLQLACDAGAIGAGGLVQRSTDVTDPTTNANLRNAVQRFFNANFSPAPWRASQLSYNSSITQDNTTKVRTIFVTASYNVPMLFMRVLGVNNSTVAAQAIAKLRFVNLILVVDRSGSVTRTGSGTLTNPQIIQNALNTFVGDSTTSVFKNGRDVIGMVTFGGNYNLDYAPSTNFQTSSPNITTAINNITFNTNNSTNTGEGLYQGWYQLTQLSQAGALNVIVLITDGRPSAFTGQFAVDSGSPCTNRTDKLGVVSSSVTNPFPPPSNRTKRGVLNFLYAGVTDETQTWVSNSAGCSFVGDSSRVTNDIHTIPTNVGPQDHKTGTSVPSVTSFTAGSGYYAATSDLTDAVQVRYTAFNYAFNVAKAIRQDATNAPVIYCIGLNFDTSAYPSEEPLDADFLATIANDPNYRSTGKPSGVYQAGQTPGKYYDVSYSGLESALQDIAGQILRLSAH